MALGERDGWGANILFDPTEVCLLHQLHRVKASQLEAQALVGMCYCMSKLFRSGTLWSAFADNLAKLVDQLCERVLSPPPAGETHDRIHRVFTLLYQMDGAHHDRKGGGKSALFQDVPFLLAMDNSGMENKNRFVHHCWTDSGRPCCHDLADTKAKMVRPYWNIFAAHSFPVASLSRWTHIRTVLAIIAAGFVARNILVASLLPALAVSSDPELAAAAINIASLGSGDADRQVEHSMRKFKVQQSLVDPSTPYQVAIVYLTCSVLDRMVYHPMGGSAGADRARRPGTLAKADQPIHIKSLMLEVRQSRGEYLQLLKGFSTEGSRSGDLLGAMGVSPAMARSGDCVRFMRKLCLGMSCGVFRRMEICLASWPYKLWPIVDGSTTEEGKQAIAQEFLAARPCCLGYFAGRLRALLDTEAKLRGPLGAMVLTVWLRTLTWSVYGCEREHGSIRRLVGGGGANSGPLRCSPWRPESAFWKKRAGSTWKGCVKILGRTQALRLGFPSDLALATGVFRRTLLSPTSATIPWR